MADGKMQGSLVNTMNNQPIEGAAVAVTPGDHSATSRDDGTWGPVDLAAAEYDVTVTKEGFRGGVYGPIVVTDDNTTELKFGLEPAPW